MNKKNLMPIAAEPVNRTTTGQLSPELAELSEEALYQLGADASSDASLRASSTGDGPLYCYCSYDGDDAE
jgi:bacteriocin leader peptide (microcyclamide/patellamide family)